MKSNKSRRESDVYTQMHNDHKALRDNLKQFRRDPSIMVQHLQDRIQRYKKVKDQTYLFSNQHKKKAVLISEEKDPQDKIEELISILTHYQSPIGQTIEISKLYECASKICQTIVQRIPQQVIFKPETTQLIRKMLEADDSVKFPNQIKCLISISYNEEYEPLMTLLVDDDLQDRPNRSILLNSHYKYFGICSAIPKDHQYLKCTVYLLTDKAQRRLDPTNIVSIESSNKQINYEPTLKQTRLLQENSHIMQQNHKDNPIIRIRQQGSQLHQSNISEGSRIHRQQKLTNNQ